MPRGPRLNDQKKGQIRAYKDTGKRNNWIARKLNRSSNVIDKFVKVLAYILFLSSNYLRIWKIMGP